MKRDFADKTPEAVRGRRVDDLRVIGGMVVDALCVLSWQHDESTVGNIATAGAVVVASTQMVGPIIRSSFHLGRWELEPRLSQTPKSEM